MVQRTVSLRIVPVLAALSMAGCERSASPAKEASATSGAQEAAVRADQSATGAPSEVKTDDSTTSRPEAAAATTTAAYYFHRTMRCPTCLSIEEQAREAVEAGFAGELLDGPLEWYAVNIEGAGNEHFENDFELSTSSLVLVERVGDDVVRWKNLERVWELVDDPTGFQEYVWAELTDFLESSEPGDAGRGPRS